MPRFRLPWARQSGALINASGRPPEGDRPLVVHALPG
jgi:hypothetical protein